MEHSKKDPLFDTVDPTAERADWFVSVGALAEHDRDITSEDPMPVVVKPIRSPLLIAGVVALLVSLGWLAFNVLV
jgi:hypothetical protein